MTTFPGRRPVVFGLVVTVSLLVVYVAAGIVAALTTTEAAGQRVVEALARLGGAAACGWIVWRVGLAANVGLIRAGTWGGWLIVALVLAFQMPIQLFAFFGSLTVPVADWTLPSAVALNGAAAGVLEELAFRGLLLFGLLRAWADSPRRVLKSVALSCVLFGAAHFIRLPMGAPVAEVSLLVLDAAISGIFYAGIVLYARSIWPAVAYHVVPNAMVGAFAAATPGFSETVGAWVPILVSEIPVVALGVYLLVHATRRGEKRGLI
jgi:membrane protease YdiL (CAAX protease family)